MPGREREKICKTACKSRKNVLSFTMQGGAFDVWRGARENKARTAKLCSMPRRRFKEKEPVSGDCDGKALTVMITYVM